MGMERVASLSEAYLSEVGTPSESFLGKGAAKDRHTNIPITQGNLAYSMGFSIFSPGPAEKDKCMTLRVKKFSSKAAIKISLQHLGRESDYEWACWILLTVTRLSILPASKARGLLLR